ncbi:hypothetical protein PVAP13_4KG377302 [Panicum virgatum]|uniref:Uncharacterized protein n=1 Tax=Panicum virgatum TaxID=38727 RepID=A0A8T0U1J7_PANVG|nr:hypothetical protein PVAP13_4KG377302 [Panicum virgatum]
MGHAWCRDEEEEVRWTPHQSPVATDQQSPVAPLAHRPPTRSHARPAGELQAWQRGGRATMALPMDGSGRFFLLDHLLHRCRWGKGGRRWLALAPWEAVNYSTRTPPPAVAAAGTGTVGLGKCSASIELTSASGTVLGARAPLSDFTLRCPCAFHVTLFLASPAPSPSL